MGTRLKGFERLRYHYRQFGLVTGAFRVLNRCMDRAVRLLRPNSVGRDESVTLANGRTLLLNREDTGFSVDILVGKGLREPLVSQYLIKHLPRMNTFLDMGANIGYYSMLLADKFERVLAVEPLEENLEFVVRSARSNGLEAKVVPIAAAVTTEGRPVRFARHAKRNWSRIANDGDVEVSAVTLPQLSERYGDIDFLKMDVEGYEHNIIVGAQEWFERNGPVYFFYEHHFTQLSAHQSNEIFGVLGRAGYRIDVAFFEVNPPVGWGWSLLDRLHLRIKERSLRPHSFVMYRDQPLRDVANDEAVMDGRYGAIEFILRRESGNTSSTRHRESVEAETA